MSERIKVAVLLAAYNGKNWIEEQIQTILMQTDVEVTVFISVDQSTDNTEELITNISRKIDNIRPLPYGRKFGGAAKNFYRLIEDVDFTEFDFVSLSDQDDIWYPHKLITAIRKISEGYDFYSSNVMAFWPSGRKKIINKAQTQVKYDYFFEAAGPGCTYVFNAQKAFELKKFFIENHHLVNDIALHDWLIYAFARNNNYKWYIDNAPSMNYRQHSNNQVGANVTFSAALKRIKLIKNKWYRQEILKLATLFKLPENHFVFLCLQEKKLINIFIIKNIHKTRRRIRDRLMLLCASLLNWL